MDIEGSWKLASFIILIQIIQCKKFIGKHNNGTHFLISTKHAANMHASSKLDLHNKKSFKNPKAQDPFFNNSNKPWLRKKNNLKGSINPSHDYQGALIGLNSSIIPTGE